MIKIEQIVLYAFLHHPNNSNNFYNNFNMLIKFADFFFLFSTEDIFLFFNKIINEGV